MSIAVDSQRPMTAMSLDDARPSCRNSSHPDQRWQFTGLRLAKDL